MWFSKAECKGSEKPFVLYIPILWYIIILH